MNNTVEANFYETVTSYGVTSKLGHIKGETEGEVERYTDDLFDDEGVDQVSYTDPDENGWRFISIDWFDGNPNSPITTDVFCDRRVHDFKLP